MEHGVLRLGGEWVASRKRHWPARCWSSGAEVTMGSGESDSLGWGVRGQLFPPPRLAGNSHRPVTRSWPCCVWSFADGHRGFRCSTWPLVECWKRVSRNRRFHQAPARDPLPSPPSGGAVISASSRALPALLVERAPSHGAGRGGDTSSQPLRSNPRGRTRGKRGVWAETETRIKP